MTEQAAHDVRRSERFGAAHRVRERRDYARSRTEGRRVSSASFMIEVTRNPERSRLGLVVSRRVGGAVQRNRVKRITREWFRRSRSGFSRTADIVVIARVGSADLSTSEAWADLTALAARALR